MLKELYGEYDLDAIKTLVRYCRIYGKVIVEEAFDIVQSKGTSNPKRSIRYLFGTIEGIAKKAEQNQ